ncbi:MAG: AAA family ATPase [Pseudomonadota bacterium]
MKLKYITIENFRGIREKMFLPLHSRLTILVGDNANGKTTILDALATGLGIVNKNIDKC